MRSVTVDVMMQPYEILIEEGLLDSLGDQLAQWRGRKAMVVADSRTAELFGERALRSLQSAQLRGTLLTVPRGEASKSHQQLLWLYDQFLDQRLSRKDVIIALGGGVVGDLTGYAAASFLRGVPLVQVPTTLLSMVDSSVGGKVAVNLPRGKNLVGAFYQPRRVLIDPATLDTLDRRELGAGLCEVIKYGAILSEPLFETLESAGGWANLTPLLPGLIADCCELKARVVGEDPLDTGHRMILNFGHTLGHAVEQASGLAVPHGEAVGIGMVAAAALGESLGRTPSGTARRIQALLQAYGLPTGHTYPTEVLLQAMTLDKKAFGDHVNVVLLRGIGQCELYSLPVEQLPALAEAKA